MKQSFVRCVVGDEGQNHRILNGVISEVRILRDKGKLSLFEVDELKLIFLWFNENLPVPPFSTKKWSKQAVTWFKDSAKESIAKTQELLHILRTHNKPVKMLRSTHPGKILYEDEFQVVVEEFKQI